ncbi:hypothetical protein H8K32_17270 [Undibacterium jejuense]|uniref:Type IV pilin accessory protein n=1 Tax=Undibacterium jejuense TaxID=1344949 RepID=A0A923HIV4_9BURK|nr:hypothetical protein [Undibacterium jejuense]MBC3863860.1 hypothetical protein [Undibacterium jejuense]
MKHRIRAGLLHLLISLVLVSSVMAFVLLICYPEPYFTALGAGKLLLVLACVDVGLGPLITFLIFVPGKKGLKFDLVFIAVVQLAALTYGATTLFLGRPVYIVFSENHFSLVSAYQIPSEVLEDLHNPSLPMNGPKLVGARIPADKAERKKYINAVLVRYHVDLPRLVQYHVPYSDMVKEVKLSMFALEELLAKQKPEQLPKAKAMLDKAVASTGLPYDRLAYVPMSEQSSSLVVLIRRSDASVVSVLPIDPYGRPLSQ